MSWFDRNKPSPDREKRPPQRGDLSRRKLLRNVGVGLLAEGIAEVEAKGGVVTDAAEFGAGKILDAIASYNNPVPQDLQQRTRLPRRGRKKKYMVGFSIAAGTGAGNISIVKREGDGLRERGIEADIIPEAVPGSTVNELGKQWDHAKTTGKVPPKEIGETREMQAWTGGNEVTEGMLANMKSLQSNPWQLGRWGQLRQDAEDIATNYEQQFATHGTRMVREGEGDIFTAYTIPDETKAKRIDKKNPETGKTTLIHADDNSLPAKVVKAAAKIGINQVQGSLYRAVRKIRDETGVHTTVIDANKVITPRSFGKDVHINEQTAEEVAQLRVDNYDIEE